MNRPLIFTLFGSTGDLALRMVIPALYALFRENRLAKKFSIVAFSRRPWQDTDYRAFIRPYLEKIASSPEHLNEFLGHFVYIDGTFQDFESYKKLLRKISDVEKGCGQCQKVFYLAIQPEFYRPVVSGLSDIKLLSERSSRILVEKPFGHDEQTARDLESFFEEKIKPEQLLHIDHYMAKEGYRDVVETRKRDLKFEPKLSAVHVASIKIRIWEYIGIEGRGEFYERVGALLDVAQNHLLEMLAVILMDVSEKNENKARAKALQALHLIGEPVVGQYVGYNEERDVDFNSKTETYVGFNIESSDPRWQGVPIHLETGKAMAQKKSDITIYFKDGTHRIFDINESVSGREAYEIVLEKAIKGDLAYFASFAEIEAAWRVIDPILKKRDTLEVRHYPQGTNGPML